MNEKNGTAGNDLKSAFGILKNMVTRKAKDVFGGISEHTKDILKNMTDPKERFNRAVRAQHDALINAGCDESQANRIALELVVEALKDSNSKKGQRQ